MEVALWFLYEVLLCILVLQEVRQKYSQFRDPSTHVLQSDRRIIVSPFDVKSQSIRTFDFERFDAVGGLRFDE